ERWTCEFVARVEGGSSYAGGRRGKERAVSLRTEQRLAAGGAAPPTRRRTQRTRTTSCAGGRRGKERAVSLRTEQRLAAGGRSLPRPGRLCCEVRSGAVRPRPGQIILEGPIRGQSFAELLKVRVVGVFDSQTLEGGVQLLQVHLNRARDHTRGLL